MPWHLAAWLRDPASAASTALTLESLTVPAAGAVPGSWELSYSCDRDPEHLFTVPMAGWTPTGDVQTDG